MLYTIYVDSEYGSDTNTGELTSPVKTLSYALSQVYEGGVIVLQTGDGASYGSLSVLKNVTIQAAYGASPKVGSLNLSGMQGLMNGLTFESLTTGITASNLSLGSLIVRACRFDSVTTPIAIDSVNYVSLHRNSFYNFGAGIRITSANEVCVSSNIFSGGQRAIDVNTVNRLDLWRNTVYGAMSMPPVLNPDTNIRVIYKTLNAFDITYKRFQLPGYASISIGGYDVAFNVVNGPSFNYGVDYTVLFFGSMVSWAGMALDGQLAIGDVVRVLYSEAGGVGSGDAIRVQNVGDQNSRVDSNSLSGAGVAIDIGVYFSTPVKVAHNNFDNVTAWWQGGTPTGSTGMQNFGLTAMYRDPLSEDFRLQPSSPNIDRGDPGRWNNIFDEMGIIKIDGRYTASYTGIRDNVAPFDRDLDFDVFHRGVTGMHGVTGDVGAFEFNIYETAMGNYVAEQGYDISSPGTETGPYATVDRGYNRAGSLDLYIDTHIVPTQDGPTGVIEYPVSGSRYGRYRSKSIILSDSDIIVGTRTKEDVIVIYPSHPALETGLVYVSPDGDDTYTGTLNSPYRTIDKALQSGQSYVIVEPGVYPSFAGATGIQLIGVLKYPEINFSGILYSNVRDGSWTGIGSYDYTNDSMILDAPSNILGMFTFSMDIDFKAFATVKSDNLTIKLFNADNSVYLRIDRKFLIVTYGYQTNGITYEINNAFVDDLHTPDELFTNLKVRLQIKANKFYLYFDNEYIHGSYSNIFSTGSLINFRPQFYNSGSGEDVISEISTMSGSMTGATGIHHIKTLKKSFSITGATGIQV